MSDPVEDFEELVADYIGSYYGVAVDCCTNALFLSLLYLKKTGEIKKGDEIIVPRQTYHQVPKTVERAGLKIHYKHIHWTGIYPLSPTRIYDSALLFEKGAYVMDSLYCLSFNYRKGIPIGKGGMILVDDKKTKDWLARERYDRYLYMTPEQATRGISLFKALDKKYSYQDYEDLK